MLELRRETSRIADSLALLRADSTGFQKKISGIVADAVREGLKTR